MPEEIALERVILIKQTLIDPPEREEEQLPEMQDTIGPSGCTLRDTPLQQSCGRLQPETALITRQGLMMTSLARWLELW
jgi:hypothetical protein